MRTAILIYGEYRTMDIASKTWKFENCFNEFDIYVSTWDYTKNIRKNKTIDETKSFVVTEDMIKRSIPSAIVNISEYNDKEFYLNMIYHFKTGLNLISNSNINYDSILITRTDLSFTFLLKNNKTIEIKDLEDNVIYGNSDMRVNGVNPLYYYVSDVIFFGKLEDMKIIFNNIPEQKDTHRFYAQHLLDNNHYMKHINKFPHFGHIDIVRIDGFGY